ncbi:Phage protein [Devosia sp. DBB001]|nr:Phage protein [Devosia sp. DBB001]
MRAPVSFTWDGEAMTPSTQFHARNADREFVVGERYVLVEEKQRSTKTHNHEFAALHEAWANLPERYADEAWAQSPEHLRKYALIKTKFCDTQTYTCGSHAEAKRWAANIRPLDEYSLVTVYGSTVIRFTAKSQSRKAMDAVEFQASKTAVLEFISSLLDVAPAELAQAAGMAA